MVDRYNGDHTFFEHLRQLGCGFVQRVPDNDAVAKVIEEHALSNQTFKLGVQCDARVMLGSEHG